MEEKQRCLICGKTTTKGNYCNLCGYELKFHTVRESLKNERTLFKLLTKNGCMNCPIQFTEFCKMTEEHCLCNNATDELNLCEKYLNNWFNSHGEVEK